MLPYINSLKRLIICILIPVSFAAQGQQAFTFSVFNEATTIPFTSFLNAPIHPGFQVGTEFPGKERKNFRIFPSINLGYMFHKNLFQGLYANADMGVDFKTSFGFHIKSKMGIGYLHTFTTKQEYILENGSYVPEKDKGNSRIMPSLSLGLGYALDKNDVKSPEIFMFYQSWLEYPYSPGFIPLMSHTNVHLGAKFFISK